MRWILPSVILVAISSTSFAAIPKNSNNRLESILSAKGNAKYDKLRNLGANVYWDLKTIAFNENKNMNIRWAALMALAKLGEKQSVPEMKQALRAKDWYMRDGALKVLPAFDKEEASKAAIFALDDSALVVRTTAVDAIRKLKRAEASEKLWTMLYSKDNFMKKQSLWIRRHIVEALSEVAPKGSESKFIKVFDDADSTLYAPAIAGLERLSGKKLGDADMPAQFKRYEWQKWWTAKK